MATSQTKNGNAAGQESLLPVFAALFQGVAANTIRGDPEQYRQFRAKMQKVADMEGVRESTPELTMKAETAVNLLQHHCTRVNEHFLSQVSELKAVVELMVATLTDLAVAKPENAQQLQAVTQRIKDAVEGAALRQGRTDLEQCLSEVRKEAERGVPAHREASAQDPITGLETRPAAEAVLVEACKSETPTSAVVLLLDRLRLYNQRYGREVGDRTLRFFAEHLKHSLQCEGALFRWSGPALLLLRSGPVDKVQPEMRKVLEMRLQYDCETGSRHLLLSVDARWSVLPMMIDPRLLINKIDAFIAT